MQKKSCENTLKIMNCTVTGKIHYIKLKIINETYNLNVKKKSLWTQKKSVKIVSFNTLKIILNFKIAVDKIYINREK